jgi:hypothetical protein
MKMLLTLAGVVWANTLPEGSQGGKEGDRSVPVIVVGAGADVSLA